MNINMVIFYLIIILGLFLYSRKNLIISLKDFKNNFKKYIGIILKYSLGCFILMMVSNYLIQLVLPNLPSNEINNRTLLENNIFLALFYLLLLAPALEEYLFRYSFKKIKSYPIYILITSLLFASLHLLSINNLKELIYIIPYFIIGFGLGNIFFKTKNYYASLIGHIIHNALCVIIIMLF